MTIVPIIIIIIVIFLLNFCVDTLFLNWHAQLKKRFKLKNTSAKMTMCSSKKRIVQRP